MSRTYKDRPYSLGGHRTKYFCVNNHGSHGRFTRECRVHERRYLDRWLDRYGELVRHSPLYRLYFD